MRRQLVPAVVSMVIFTLALGLAYPLVVTAISQLAWPDKANGSMIEVDGQVVGSKLIGQRFTLPAYFWPRPSAVGEDGYEASTSGGSNLGPTNPDFLDSVAERVAAYRDVNGLSDDVAVPVDAVTASGSGLDPDISVANATLQAHRVAEARGVSPDEVLAVLHTEIKEPAAKFLDTRRVNVLELNLALDRALPRS